MPLLREILHHAVDKSHWLLRAKALECISLVGMAIGRERFRDDAHKVLVYMQQLQARPSGTSIFRAVCMSASFVAVVGMSTSLWFCVLWSSPDRCDLNEESCWRSCCRKKTCVSTCVTCCVGVSKSQASVRVMLPCCLRGVVHVLQAAGLAAEDPTTGYMLQAGARLCKCLREEFLPYLQVVMPPLLNSAQLRPDVAVLNESDEEDDDEEVLPSCYAPFNVRAGFLMKVTSSAIEVCLGGCLCSRRANTEAIRSYNKTTEGFGGL
jgi:hypothetical protein